MIYTQKLQLKKAKEKNFTFFIVVFFHISDEFFVIKFTFISI